LKIDGINPGSSDIIKEAYSGTREEDMQDFSRLLERAQQERDDKRLKEVCREMEAVFLSTMLQRMRATVNRDGLIKESLGENIFTSMLDGELAKEASGGEGIGIADLLYRQLSQNKDR
jgi:flagellar protein FlgJ